MLKKELWNKIKVAQTHGYLVHLKQRMNKSRLVRETKNHLAEEYWIFPDAIILPNGELKKEIFFASEGSKSLQEYGALFDFCDVTKCLEDNGWNWELEIIPSGIERFHLYCPKQDETP